MDTLLNTLLEQAALLGIALTGSLVGVLLLLGVLKKLLLICNPHEVIVISGRQQRTTQGNRIGYRVLGAGRAFRIPLLERADRLDCSLMSVPLDLHGAYSQGGIPLSVPAIANVKISTDARFVGNAVERFLGKHKSEIARVAKETLEGHLRSVLASMTPEEVNEDRLKFSERLREEADADLHKLGLQLDTFKILHVSDERNYLDSISRTRIAEIMREAEISESDALKAAEEIEARSNAEAEVARLEAQTAIHAQENELRRSVAIWQAQAASEEERAVAASQSVRAYAEQELQTLRGEVESLRMKADIVVPAQIQKRVQEIRAHADAQAVQIQAQAAAASLERIRTAWQVCGTDTMDMLLLQRMEQLFERASRIVSDMQVDNVSVMDGGDGKALPQTMAAYSSCVRAIVDEICHSLGSDAANVLSTAQLEGEIC